MLAAQRRAQVLIIFGSADMAGSDHVFRVHPAIGFARVGNSEDYYFAPETMAGLPVAGHSTTMGGLPIRPGTESDTITSSELRDRKGALKRQAARFRIFQYPRTDAGKYPCPGGTEIRLGSVVDGKCVVDIIWTVHIASKKGELLRVQRRSRHCRL
ncbi:LodA/GoxA family CTQ-dependent oxidase [Bradyrhizobium sp. USDA 10063]